jgi:Fe-S oxidoreductase
MDDTPRERISHIRLNEMLASGARTAALSCPFCLQLFEDAQNTLDPERSLRTADLAELVAEALDE